MEILWKILFIQFLNISEYIYLPFIRSLLDKGKNILFFPVYSYFSHLTNAKQIIAWCRANSFFRSSKEWTAALESF